jgi:uncharacterized protein YjbI with pentapeptide repeats
VTVDAPRDFAGQDLQDRSFRGQDLRGADFSDSDLRGCDFREANLIGASFERAQMGQSRRQIIILRSCIVVISIVLALCWLFTLSFNSPSGITISTLLSRTTLFLIITAFLVVSLLPRNGIFQSTFIPVSTSAYVIFLSFYFSFAWIGFFFSAVAATQAFLYFPKIHSLFSFSLAILFIFLSFKGLKTGWQATRMFPGTNFYQSNLSHATFRKATLENTSFSRATLEYIDWFQAIFKDPKEKNTWASELEVTRYGAGENYHDRVFERLYLDEVDLHHGNFKNCSFKESRLISANLMHSNLSGVNLSGTNLANADLTGAIIENWRIDRNTNFSNVRCDYIYLSQDKDPQKRKPLSGYFRPGDFEKVVASLTDTLDFLLHAHDDPQAFVKAMQEMMEAYGSKKIQPAGFEHLGDGDRLFKFAVAPGVDQAKIHAETTERISKLEIEAAVQKERADQLAAQRDSQREYINFLQDFMKGDLPKLLAQSGSHNVYADSVGDVNMSKQSIKNTGSGDMSGIAGRDLSGVAGKDIQGAAGRNLSGQVMLSIESLRQSDIPGAPTLADLLSQLKNHIDSSDLPPAAKTEAQSHIEQLAKAPTLPTPEGIKEAADKSISFFKTLSLIIPSLSSAINGLLGQITSLLG